MRNNIQSADRVLGILATFRQEEQRLSVTEVAAALGVHKSTASRLVATLVGAGFLERSPEDRSVRLGPEVARLGMLAVGGRSLVSLAQRPMQWLAQETGETVNLGVLDGHEVVNIAQVDGTHIIGIGTWTGRRTSLHCVANGKVLLVWSDRDLMRNDLERYTARTITDVDQLRAHLEEVRLRGWASNVGELEEGLHAVAVPVFDALGHCRAALSASGPSYRMAVERLPAVAALCQVAARDISQRLGRK